MNKLRSTDGTGKQGRYGAPCPSEMAGNQRRNLRPVSPPRSTHRSKVIKPALSERLVPALQRERLQFRTTRLEEQTPIETRTATDANRQLSVDSRSQHATIHTHVCPRVCVCIYFACTNLESAFNWTGHHLGKKKKGLDMASKSHHDIYMEYGAYIPSN